MAGPLSSEEIEDVVSSVRRLVSNEQRPRTRDLNAEKLVLTSAYRIVPETSPLSPLVLDAPVVEPEPQPLLQAQDVVDTAVAGADPLGVLEDSLAQALAVDAGPELAAQDDSLSALPETPLIDAVEAEWEDEIWTEPAQVSLGEAALAAEEAEVLLPPAAEAPHAEAALPDPDLADPVAKTTVTADAASDARTDDPIPFVPLRRRAEDLAARLAAGVVVEPSVPSAPSDSDDPGLQAPAQAEESAAPSLQDADPVAEDAVREPQADPAPAPVADAAAPAADVRHVATDLYDADGTPLAVLDEAALNEIVRQVLRAELQGELGERITRNVRKLVRAEINRALMARDLD